MAIEAPVLKDYADDYPHANENWGAQTFTNCIHAALVFRLADAALFFAALALRTSALRFAAMRAISERCSGVSLTMRALALAFPPRFPIAAMTALIVS
jgi:hypothetical protein